MSNLNTFTEAQFNYMNEAERVAGSNELPEKYRSLPTTSAKIRALHADGYTNVAIRKALNLKHYQHVRNVLTTPLKKAN